MSKKKAKRTRNIETPGGYSKKLKPYVDFVVKEILPCLLKEIIKHIFGNT